VHRSDSSSQNLDGISIAFYKFVKELRLTSHTIICTLGRVKVPHINQSRVCGVDLPAAQHHDRRRSLDSAARTEGVATRCRRICLCRHSTCQLD
jgi:hypothetical protein